jgi:uncharacterized membrane protein YhaH (DUF805 family)
MQMVHSTPTGGVSVTASYGVHMIECKKIYCSINFIEKLTTRGRLNRKGYISAFAFWNSMLIVSCLLAVLLFFNSFMFNSTIFNIESVRFICYAAWSLIIFYAVCNLWAMTVRRLHDINYSGWWTVLLFMPVVLGGWVFITLTLPGAIACSIRLGDVDCVKSFLNLPAEWIYVPLIYFLSGFWWLFLLIVPGTPTPNRFGDVIPISSQRVSVAIFNTALALLLGVMLFFFVAFIVIGLAGQPR